MEDGDVIDAVLLRMNIGQWEEIPACAASMDQGCRLLLGLLAQPDGPCSEEDVRAIIDSARGLAFYLPSQPSDEMQVLRL